MQWQNLLYYLVWAGLFFLMMRFGCGAHIMGHGHHHGDSSQPESDTDPVCGMKVQAAGAKTAAYQSRIYYFCSQDCRGKFEANPSQYAKASASGAHDQEHHHGCC